MNLGFVYSGTHCISGFQKQRNIKSWDQNNHVVIKYIFICNIWPLYNKVPRKYVYHVIHTKSLNESPLPFFAAASTRQRSRSWSWSLRRRKRAWRSSRRSPCLPTRCARATATTGAAPTPGSGTGSTVAMAVRSMSPPSEFLQISLPDCIDPGMPEF